MKNIYSTILLMLFVSSTHAVTIDIGYDFAAIANSATLSGSFSTNGLDSNLASITDDSAATYILNSPSGPASVELTFGTSIYAGSGTDLSIFFVDAAPHIFDLTISSAGTTSTVPISSEYLDNNTHPAWTYTGWCLDVSTVSGCESNSATDLPIYVMDIDLNEFSAFDFLGQNAIDSVFMDISYQSAVPSLVAAHHLAPVPLPLPIVLFGSGLAFLGFVGRRRKKAL
jgi:hypothetical protein